MDDNGQQDIPQEAAQPQPQPQPQVVDPAQLLAYVQQLEIRLRGLADRVPANPPPPRLDAPKPAKPPTFGGRVNESIDTWLFNIEQYNLVVPMEPRHLIPFAASFLTEHTATWWRHTYIEQQRLRPGAQWTWENFKEGLLEQFRPVTSEQSGRDRLHTLKQTSSVANYISAFQSIVVNIPSMSEEDRLDRFLRGLKGEIHERVAIQQPRTLTEACRMANTIDTIRYQARFHHQPNRTTPPTRSTGVIPMEIDAIRRGALTDQERDHLRKTGGCFFCREPGHMARSCPKKRKQVSVVESMGLDDLDSGKDQAQ
jgi:Ty3 transposon capsid-like protein/Zinc knuckle